MTTSYLSLDSLPVLVSDHIFSYLTYAEIVRLRVLNKTMLRMCGLAVRKGIKTLKVLIEQQIFLTHELLDGFILTNSEDMFVRNSLLRSYNTLEILLNEVNLISVLCRDVLYKDGTCFPGGALIDRMYEVLDTIRNESYTCSYNAFDACNVYLQRHINDFMDNFEDTYHSKERRSVPFGVQIVDMLDMMLDNAYYITVVYDGARNVCEINAQYDQRSAKFLIYVADITLQDCDNCQLTDEEAELTLKSLALTVRIHNRHVIKDEQYWREMEITRRLQEQQHAQGYSLSPASNTGTIAKPPRKYSTIRECWKRTNLDGNRIEEVYRNKHVRTKLTKGMLCNINLVCSLDEAPLQILQSWKNINADNEMFGVENDTVENDLQKEQIYYFCFNLEVSFSRRNDNQVFDICILDGLNRKQMLEHMKRTKANRKHEEDDDT